MKRNVCIGVFVLLSVFNQSVKAQQQLSGVKIIEESIARMGGEDQLRSIENLQIEGIGHTYLLEQSERPEGPWIVNYNQVKQIVDFKSRRLFLEKQNKNSQQREWQGATILYEEGILAMKLSDGQVMPARPALEEEINELFDIDPAKLLLAALDSEDIKVHQDTVVQGIAQKRISFTYKATPLDLFLNSNTFLPTLLQFTKSYPRDIMWSAWGEVKTDIFFSLWSLTSDGILYPMQYNKYRNGQPLEEFTIVDLRVNQELKNEIFSIPDNVKAAYTTQPILEVADIPLGRPDKKATELAPGVLLIPGYWNVVIVEQDDGVLLLEAPISEEYTAQALTEARKIHPKKELKGVISTSDAWPHIAGVGEGVRQNLPIYTYVLNQSLLSRLISKQLENQERNKPNRKTDIRNVSTKMVVGTGRNRIELYPIMGESSERMLMIYFPEHKLLYASDLVQLNRDGSFFQKAYLKELVAAIDRHHLDVQNVFAMHTDLLKYNDITDSLK